MSSASSCCLISASSRSRGGCLQRGGKITVLRLQLVGAFGLLLHLKGHFVHQGIFFGYLAHLFHAARHDKPRNRQQRDHQRRHNHHRLSHMRYPPFICAFKKRPVQVCPDAGGKIPVICQGVNGSSTFSCALGRGGSSRMSEMPKCSRKRSVVAYRMGRPSASLRPASRMSPLCRSD